MTPERQEEIKGIIEDAGKFGKVGGIIASELLAALEEAQQQIEIAKGAIESFGRITTDMEDDYRILQEKYAVAQQTITRQQRAWQELKDIVSTNATGGKGEDINDYDIMLNIMGDLEGETQP